MRALGVSEDQIDHLSDEDEETDDLFLVYPENWQTVQVFQRVADNWDIVSGMGGIFYQALKSERIESVLRLMQIPDSKKLEIYDNLRTMQEAAKGILNERE